MTTDLDATSTLRTSAHAASSLASEDGAATGTLHTSALRESSLAIFAESFDMSDDQEMIAHPMRVPELGPAESQANRELGSVAHTLVTKRPDENNKHTKHERVPLLFERQLNK